MQQLKQKSFKNTQQGFALFIVMLMMMVTAVLVVAAAQTYNTELRISSNDADRKAAAANAEAELHAGEEHIAQLLRNGQKITFTENCMNRLCSAAGSTGANYPALNITVNAANNIPAWKRSCNKKLCLESGAKADKNGLTSQHIIEFISYENNKAIFRITAFSKGRNTNTSVTLQSYVEVSDE